MKRLVWVLGLIFFLLLALSANPAFAETITLNPVADSYVLSASPATNRGNASFLSSFHNDFGDRAVPFLKFDLSSIPKNSSINDATFQLFVNAAAGPDPISLNILRVTEDWEENTIKWNNKPSAATASATAAITYMHVYQSWDITGLVQGWVNETYPNYGFLIYYEGRPVSYSRTFDSREGATKPRLIVDFTPPVAPTPPPGPPHGPAEDTTPPTISKVKVINVTQNNATITWVTDEDSNSFVDYGLTKSYGLSTGKYDSTTDHSVQLFELKPDKLYHFRVRSKDAAGNEETSSDYVFKTKELPKPKAPAPEKAKPSVDWTKILIIALSVLAVLLIAAIIVVTILYRRRGKTQQ
jgi:hypothetical protein